MTFTEAYWNLFVLGVAFNRKMQMSSCFVPETHRCQLALAIDYLYGASAGMNGACGLRNEQARNELTCSSNPADSPS